VSRKSAISLKVTDVHIQVKVDLTIL